MVSCWSLVVVVAVVVVVAGVVVVVAVVVVALGPCPAERPKGRREIPGRVPAASAPAGGCVRSSWFEALVN